MKKVALLCASVLLVAPLAWAGNAKDNTGCGLGTMLFGDQADDSIVLQSLAVTTNGTSANQTFGITSGTSECEKPSKIASTERMNEYVLANLDNLAKDIARGGGETVDGLADLMGIPEAERAAFVARLQGEFGRIFPNPDVDYAYVVDAIVEVSADG